MADDDFWMQVEQEEMQQWYAQTKQEFKDKFNEIFEVKNENDTRDIQRPEKTVSRTSD